MATVAVGSILPCVVRHEVRASRAASAVKQIQPLNAEGKPASDGKIVLLSIGMSNTTQEFSVFKRVADADSRKAANVLIVDGAQGGKDARNWSRAAMEPWSVAERRITSADATPQQVQVLWIKQAIAGPREGWPAATDTLRELLGDMLLAWSAELFDHADDPIVEMFESGVGALQRHAWIVAQLRELGWTLVAYTGECSGSRRFRPALA